MKKQFQLAFWGGTTIRYKRNHADLESAEAEARKVLNKMSNRGAHPAVIYEAGKGHPVASVN